MRRPTDRTKFPLFDRATPCQTLLGPGEIIYIPRRYPHHAIATEDSVSLTLNFLPKGNYGNVMPNLSRYLKARRQCQKILQRTLRVKDNMMQMCVHGGSIKCAPQRSPLPPPHS